MFGIIASSRITMTAELSQGLFAYYKLDNNGDDSFGSNNMTSVEPIYNNDGVINQCASFDRNRIHSFNRYASTAFSPTYTGFSISFWMNRSTIGIQDWILTKAQGEAISGTNIRDWEICLYSGIMYWDIYFPNSNSYQGMYVMETGNLPVDQWNHVVCTYDGSGMYQGLKVYTNGYLPTQYYEGTGTVLIHQPNEGTLSFGVQTFAIGNEQFNYNGRLDEIGFWNRELNQMEVLELYSKKPYPFT